MKKYNLLRLKLILFTTLLIVGCNRNSMKSGKNSSQGTGWKINSKDGGFQGARDYKGQPAGPGLVFVEGGTYTKGNVKDNVMHDWNNTPTQQYVRSYFIDETEVTNEMYGEYLYWMKTVFAENFSEIYKAALPDTLVWRNPLGFNEDMVNNYLRHPAFQNHPVVGVSWKQAVNFAKWRTDRVNEQILVSKGFLKDSVRIPKNIADGYTFNTEAYLIDPENAYGGKMNEYADDKSKESTGEGEEEKVNYATRETGILLPEYRLPTETEWEYAALALSEITNYNAYRGKKKFPWDGEYTRSGKKKNVGDQLANFKLSDGDYGGIAGWSEVGSGITTSVRSYPPNDFGLYGMGGNVAEWVADVYRPIIDEDANDFNYYRGNVYKKNITEDGKVKTVGLDDANYDYLPGSVLEEVEKTEDIDRVNYSTGDNRNFNDGDLTSTREGLEPTFEGDYAPMYNNINKDDKDKNATTLVDDEARVFKGGSWLDRAYYLDPAQRRYLPGAMTTNFIGFRCAMSYLGDTRNTQKPNKR
tara:strand:- start:416 stop:1996 length:1581 start_codon:yes stop_codon:yes gene_type:complete